MFVSLRQRHVARRDSSLKDRWEEYPVVHISWTDASARGPRRFGWESQADFGTAEV